MVTDLTARLSRESLAEIQGLVLDARGNSHGGIERAYDLSMGLTNYDLQKPAKQTEVFYFPILAMMPHVQGNGDTATRFKVIDGINTGDIEGWVPEGQRQQTITSHLSDKSVSYATFGLEDKLTWEAKGAANGFEDAMSRMQTNLMLATQRSLEKAVCFANTTIVLGTPTAPTLADLPTGGAIAAAAVVRMAVVALTPHGLEASTVAAGVVQPVTSVGADGANVTNGYGASMVSNPSSQLTIANDGNNTHRVSATTPAIVGAAGYAWFSGVDTTHMYLTAITTLNSVVITALGTAATQISTVIVADHSATPGAWDGLLSLALQYGVVVTQATGTAGTGTGLTSDGAGGIVEIETLFQNQWDTTKTTPKWLVMSSQEARNIRTKTINNGAAPLFRFNVDAGDTNPLTAGRVVGSYLNMFTPDGGALVKIILHPYCPKGTIFAFTDTLPGELIPNSNIGQLFEFHIPSPEDGMHATQWPVVTRRYTTGVYIRGAVAHYFPQSMCAITNIGNV